MLILHLFAIIVNRKRPFTAIKKGVSVISFSPSERAVPSNKMAISVAEFATLLSISRPKAYEIIRRSDFNAVFKLGKRTLISVPRALEWIEAQASKNEKP